MDGFLWRLHRTEGSDFEVGRTHVDRGGCWTIDLHRSDVPRPEIVQSGSFLAGQRLRQCQPATADSNR